MYVRAGSGARGAGKGRNAGGAADPGVSRVHAWCGSCLTGLASEILQSGQTLRYSCGFLTSGDEKNPCSGPWEYRIWGWGRRGMRRFGGRRFEKPGGFREPEFDHRQVGRGSPPSPVFREDPQTSSIPLEDLRSSQAPVLANRRTPPASGLLARTSGAQTPVLRTVVPRPQAGAVRGDMRLAEGQEHEKTEGLRTAMDETSGARAPQVRSPVEHRAPDCTQAGASG